MDQTYTSLKEALENNKNIVKRKKNCIIPLVMIFIGILCFVLKSLKLEDNYYLSKTIIFIGLIFMVLGIIYFIKSLGANAYDYRHLSTGKKCKKQIVYINNQDIKKVNSAISSGNYTLMEDIKKEDNSGCYLNIIGHHEIPFYTIQLMSYVPHKFEPVSDAVVLEGKDARSLAHWLNFRQ